MENNTIYFKTRINNNIIIVYSDQPGLFPFLLVVVLPGYIAESN